MSVEKNMNKVLARILPNWTALWNPRPDSSKHGEILLEEQIIMVYDTNPSEAWTTFQHELVELRLREVTRPYRELVNSLISLIEKLTYQRKESFIDSLPELFEIVGKVAPTPDAAPAEEVKTS